jgi:nanoRNase/pAp phosphatase (c-di-AMP/oligoRNAs hydrolase)
MPPDPANPSGPNIKVSMRSKAMHPAIDVNAIAMKMNGGGHVRAAGAKLRAANMDVAMEIIEAHVAASLRAAGVRV